MKLPCRRFGRTNLEMPILSLGGMRFQKSWDEMKFSEISLEDQKKVEDILNIAIEQQLQAISITDHEFLSEVENTNLIEIIPGVEMSVSWYDLELENPFAGIHLLIYFLKKILFRFAVQLPITVKLQAPLYSCR